MVGIVEDMLLVGSECDDGSNVEEIFIHFINLLSPSAPKLSTVIPCLAHSFVMYSHLGSRSFAQNLLSVPKHARQNGGTFCHKGCAM